MERVVDRVHRTRRVRDRDLENVADALGVREAQIGIKATTNELMGFIGREEGIAAMAVASVDLP